MERNSYGILYLIFMFWFISYLHVRKSHFVLSIIIDKPKKQENICWFWYFPLKALNIIKTKVNPIQINVA